MNKKPNVRKLAVTGILLGITLFLGLTPYGIISIPPANMSFLTIPVIIGTLYCSLSTGLLLGTVFGLTSVFKAFSEPSVLVTPLMGVSPLYIIIMSVGARIMIPLVVHFVHKVFMKKGLSKTGIGVSALCGSLTNTVLYLGLMLLFYTMCGLDNATLLAVVGGVGALNGSLEAVAAVVLTVPIMLAINKTNSKKEITNGTRA